MQQRRDTGGVGADAGHIGRGGKAANAQRPSRMADEFGLESVYVDVAGRVLRDDDDVGDGFPPWQLV